MLFLRGPSCPLWLIRTLPNFSLKFGGREKFLRGVVLFDVKNIRFAAHLAVFYVDLAAAGGFIHDGRVPFSARCTLEARFHVAKSIRYSYGFWSEAERTS